MYQALVGGARGAAAFAILVLAACGGGGGGTGDGGSPPVTYAVGGTVSGLSGSGLVLRNINGDHLAITGNGAFTFAARVTRGTAYSVEVATQPVNPIQNCLVMNGGGAGVVQAASVTTVSVVCADVGKFLYAYYPPQEPYGGCCLASSLYAFSIDPVTGALTPATGSPFATASTGLTMASGGKFAYALKGGGIGGFAIDLTSGAIAEIAGSPFAAPSISIPDFINIAFSIAIDPSGRYLYAAFAFYGSSCRNSICGTSLETFAIDPATGALASIGGAPFTTPLASGSLAIDALGRYLYQSDCTCNGVTGDPGGVQIFKVDPATGLLTYLGPTQTPATWPLSLSSDGRFAYWVDTPSGAIRTFAIDPDTGALTQSGDDSAGIQGLVGVTVDPSGRFLYGACTGGLCVAETDPATGVPAPSATNPVSGSGSPASIVFDPSGRYAYGVCGMTVCAFTIDATSGAPTPVVGSPFPTGGLTSMGLTLTN